jgi:hypothetical protein
MKRLGEFFERELPRIDELFIEWELPLHRRPFQAPYIFLESYIVDMQGMTKKELYKHPAFDQLLLQSGDWYRTKYGSAMEAGRDNWTLSYVLWEHAPFRVAVPLTVSKPDYDQKLVALTFPLVVLPDEQVLCWLKAPPNLQLLDDIMRTQLEDSIKDVATLLRRAQVNLVTADLRESGTQPMSSSILPTLAKGVDHACSQNPDASMSALWEFNFATEKALKVFIKRVGHEVKKTHDIKNLVSDATNAGLVDVDAAWVAAFPSGSEAISARYSEGKPIPPTRLFRMYLAALHITAGCAEQLPHEIRAGGDGATLYIKPLGWSNELDES